MTVSNEKMFYYLLFTLNIDTHALNNCCNNTYVVEHSG